MEKRFWSVEEDKTSGALWIHGRGEGDICDFYARINGKCVRYPNAEVNAALIVDAFNKAQNEQKGK